MRNEVIFENGRRVWTDSDITPKVLTILQEQFESDVIEVNRKPVTKQSVIKAKVGIITMAKKGKKIAELNPNAISWETFEEKYKPQINHILKAKYPKDEPTGLTGWGGIMYETYGDEYDYVREVAEKEPKRVWTLVDGDNGELVIIAGWHFVNRMNYVITEKPWLTGAEYVDDEIAKHGTKITDKNQTDLFDKSGVKYRAEVGGVGENGWSGNAMKYDTEEEAKDWLRDLSGRWFGFNISRVVPTSVPTNQKIDLNDPLIFQNYRKNAKGTKIRTNGVAVRELIKDLENTPHSVGLALLRERLVTHAEKDYEVSKKHPKTFQNPIFSVGMYEDLFKRIAKELNFDSGKNNVKAVKDLIKDLANTPWEVGLALLRERMMHWAEQDLKSINKNPDVFNNPIFSVGMYRDLCNRIIKFCDFGNLTSRVAEQGIKTPDKLVIEKWHDDYHVTKGDGKAIEIEGQSVFSTKKEAEEHLNKLMALPIIDIGGENIAKHGAKISRSQNQYNKEVDEYNWYVVNSAMKQVESGFEFQNDAKDLANDMNEGYPGGKKPWRVVSKRALKSLGIENPNEKWKQAKQGAKTGTGFMVFNYTDDIYASPDVFPTQAKANEFIAQFRKRFDAQGYYRDNNWNKIAPKDIDLLAIPKDFNPLKKK